MSQGIPKHTTCSNPESNWERGRGSTRPALLASLVVTPDVTWLLPRRPPPRAEIHTVLSQREGLRSMRLSRALERRGAGCLHDCRPARRVAHSLVHSTLRQHSALCVCRRGTQPPACAPCLLEWERPSGRRLGRCSARFIEAFKSTPESPRAPLRPTVANCPAGGAL